VGQVQMVKALEDIPLAGLGAPGQLGVVQFQEDGLHRSGVCVDAGAQVG